jgi:hypothetical protein
MHTHVSLFKGEENAFFDSTAEFNLSGSVVVLLRVSLSTHLKLLRLQINGLTHTSVYMVEEKLQLLPTGDKAIVAH